MSETIREDSEGAQAGESIKITKTTHGAMAQEGAMLSEKESVELKSLALREGLKMISQLLEEDLKVLPETPNSENVKELVRAASLLVFKDLRELEGAAPAHDSQDALATIKKITIDIESKI